MTEDEPQIRIASASDALIVTRLVNAAFAVEAFFKIGDRTSQNQVLELMARGAFLLLDEAPGVTVGSVFMKTQDDRGYFGMLAVDPARQGKGYGRQLIDAVEATCRDRGCRYIDIHVVNLREELPPLYRRLGYVEASTLSFPDDARASRPCHVIVMTKVLAS